MFGLSSQQSFIAGIAVLWVFSAAVAAMTPPTEKSGSFYTWFYKFLKMLSGDLTSVFGKYIPPAVTGMLIAVLCISLAVVPVIGCTQQQKVNVAQQIVNMAPQVTAAVDTVSAIASTLDPVLAPIFTQATAGFDALQTAFVQGAKDYLANPTQSNLALLQTEITKLQQNVNASVLQIAGVKNSQSQAAALAAINTVSIFVNIALGLIQSISTKAQVAAMALQVHVTYAMIRPYLDEARMEIAANRLQEQMGVPIQVTPDQFFAYERQVGF